MQYSEHQKFSSIMGWKATLVGGLLGAVGGSV